MPQIGFEPRRPGRFLSRSLLVPFDVLGCDHRRVGDGVDHRHVEDHASPAALLKPEEFQEEERVERRLGHGEGERRREVEDD